MATQDEIKAAQEVLVRAGFYNADRRTLSGAALEAQIRREVDGDPQGRTRRAIERARAAAANNSALADAIALLDPITTPSATATQAQAATRPVRQPATTHTVTPTYASPNFIVPQGNNDEWVTNDTVAQDWFKENPDPSKNGGFKTWQEVGYWIHERKKNPRTLFYKDCTETDIVNRLVIAGKPLELPPGNPIKKMTMVHRRDCDQTKPIIPGVTAPIGTPIYSWTLGGGADQGIGGRANAHDAMNLPILLGINPNMPAVAARGDNPNKPPYQTTGDGIRSFLDPLIIPAQLIGFAALGGPVTGALTQTTSGTDRANRWMVAPQGSPVTGNGDPLINISKQWLLDGDLLRNPFAPNEPERRAGTYLPGFQPVDARGRIVSPAADFAFQPNLTYQTADGAMAITFDQKSVQTGGLKRNQYYWGTPSAPQQMRIGTDIVQAQLVHDQQLLPRIHQALATYGTTTDKGAKKLAAQEYIALINFRSTLVPAIGDPSIQRETAQKRAEFIAMAKRDGITGLNEFYMDPASAVRSITKAQLRANMIRYYTEMATDKESPRGFEFVYSRIVPANEQLSGLSDPETRKRAVAQLVEHLPLVKATPENGVALPEVARFISRYDGNNPNDVRFTNLNRYEQGDRTTTPADERDPRGHMKAALQSIAATPGAIEVVLAGAGRDAKIAEALIQAARLSIDLTKNVGHAEHELRISRDAARERVKSFGFSDQTMQAIFSNEPGYGQMGNHTAVLDSAVLTRAQAEIAAIARDPQKSEAWRKFLVTFSTDGVDDKTGIFPVGASQQRLLTAIGAERPETTRDRIEALMGGKTTAHAQTLGRGIEHAIDATNHGITGSTTGEIAAYREIQRSVVGGVGTVSSTQAAAALTPAEAAKIRTTLTAVGRNVAATRLLQDVAASTAGGAPAQQLLTTAIQLPEARRKTAANAAITGYTGKVSATDQARYDQLVAAGVTNGNDATFVLTTLAGNPETAKAALGNIAVDESVSKALVAAAAGNAQLGSNMLASVSPEAKANLAALANVRPAALTTSGGIVAGTAVVAGNATTVGTATKLLEDGKTQAIALRAVAGGNPSFMQSAVIKTLTDNPTMADGITTALRAKGTERDTAWIKIGDTEQDALATIVGKLSKASDPAEKAKYAQELNSFILAAGKDAEKLQALADLNTIVATGAQSKAVLAATVVAALKASVVGAPNPLAGYAFTSADVAKVAETVVTADATGAAALAQTGLAQWMNAFTTSATFQGLPLIILPTFAQKRRDTPPSTPRKPDPGIPPGTPNECPPGTCTPVTPNTPTVTLPNGGGVSTGTGGGGTPAGTRPDAVGLGGSGITGGTGASPTGLGRIAVPGGLPAISPRPAAAALGAVFNGGG